VHLLKKVNNSSVKEVIDSIKSQNKGKLIYLDYWATWCAPCKDEMPNSKKLERDFESKDISFVYICLDSNEDAWKSSISQFKLGGKHYFMTKEQSKDMRDIYEIRGIPYYILIGKNGEVIDKGSHLRPDLVKKQIEKFLK
jgi:thiol-disulfide isomerase/thioredoxin